MSTENQNDSHQTEEKQGALRKAEDMAHQLVESSPLRVPLKYTQRFLRAVRTIGRIFAVSFQKFVKDRGMLWTSAISYSAVVSFVPTLIAVFMFGASFVNIDDIFNTVQKQLVQLGIGDFGINEYREPIKKFIKTAARVIGGIGIFVTLWSSTNVFRNLEAALNDIWKVKNQRPLGYKIAQFLIALLLGPVFFVLAITITNSMLNSFRAPDIERVAVSPEKIWLVGTRGFLAYTDEKQSKEKDMFTKVDYLKNLDLTDQEPTWIWNQAGEKALLPEYHPDMPSLTIEEPDITRQPVTAFSHYDDETWLALASGVVMRKKGDGKWLMRRFAHIRSLTGDAVAAVPELYQISALTVLRGRTVMFTANQAILYSDSFGKSWKMATVPPNINFKIRKAYLGNNGILWAIGQDGLVLRSLDLGTSWQKLNPFPEKYPRKDYDLRDIYTRGADVYIVGNDALLLKSYNNGNTWLNPVRVVHNKATKTDLIGVFFRNRRDGLVIGSNDFARFTRDGGEHWTAIQLPEGLTLNDVGYLPGIGLLGAGPKSQVVRVPAATNMAFGDLVMREDRGVARIGTILNFAATFTVIWLMFFILYVWLPYARVKARAATIGASFTAIVWVMFIFLFSYYANNLAGRTMALYGALAAIPLGLMVVYSSMAILLMGSCLAYTVQYPLTYRQPDEAREKELKTDFVWYGFRVLFRIFQNFHRGKDHPGKPELLKLVNNDGDELNEILEIFKTAGFIAEDENKETFHPARSAHSIRLSDIFDEIHNKSLDIPGYTDRQPLMRALKPLFENIKESRSGAMGDQTLDDLVRQVTEEQEGKLSES